MRAESSDGRSLRVFLALVYSVFLFSAVLALDSDKDGFHTDSSDEDLRDCDDYDLLINPNAVEVFDGVDNNCDGEVDEGKTAYYLDSDMDGYGNERVSVFECFVFENYTETLGDCDDTDFSINPSIDEVCDNGIDEDCDGRDLVCGEEVVDTNIEDGFEAVIFSEEVDIGAGLGAVVGDGESNSWVLMLVALIVIGGLVIFVIIRRREKNSNERFMPKK
ncbi:LPXTG cell wall anchor domain-containing protein [archaeon]|jgi:LPXTG-motif cell wall-anchored protein|nr:LPXTG cell wall anchor domain-containing protein [archaeon]MBT7128304.1 LPXTG cell wall anchor domain-containing protein [archaeon]